MYSGLASAATRTAHSVRIGGRKASLEYRPRMTVLCLNVSALSVYIVGWLVLSMLSRFETNKYAIPFPDQQTRLLPLHENDLQVSNHCPRG